MSKPESKTLKPLSREKAFYFFTSIGNYAGESAASLEEFAKKILDVKIKSLEFHLYRGDFERWVAEALEDNTLAKEFRELKTSKPIGIDLRDRLYLLVSKHYEALKNPRSTSTAFVKPRTTTVTFVRPKETTP